MVPIVRESRQINDGVLFSGDGATHFEVRFVLLVFRPIEGEIFDALCTDADEDGLRLSTTFFTNIHVPRSHFMDNVRYESIDGEDVFVLEFPATDENDENEHYEFGQGDWIRMRTHGVSFTSLSKGRDGKRIATTNSTELVRRPVTSATPAESGMTLEDESDKTGMGAPGAAPVMTRQRSMSSEYEETEKDPPPMTITCTMKETVNGLNGLGPWHIYGGCEV